MEEKLIENIKDTLRIIRNETRPIEGHNDPGALQDCWKNVNEDLDKLKSSNKGEE